MIPVIRFSSSQSRLLSRLVQTSLQSDFESEIAVKDDSAPEHVTSENGFVSPRDE